MNENNEIIDLDEAIESGDPELMAKALAQQSDTATHDTATKQDEALNVEAEQKAAEAQGNGDTSDQAAEQQQAEGQQVVMSKDGKHEIPYSVLEFERSQRKNLEQQLAEMRTRYNQNEIALENVKARLEQQGMNTDEMFSDPSNISEEQWAEIESDYGSMGKAMRKLFASQQANVAAMAAQEQSPAVNVDTAMNANPDLIKWRDTDPNRWAEALRLDEELKEQAEWQNKSLTERFAHIVKLTKTNFGDTQREAVERAKQTINKQTEKQVPDSLSDLGGAPVQVKSDAEALKDLPAEELEARMAAMTPSQINALFAQGF